MPVRITLPLIVVVAFGGLGVASLFFFKAVEAKGNPNVIKIVSSMPRSGSARGQTDSIMKGINLAFVELNYRLDVTASDGESKQYELQYLDLDDATAAAGDWTIEQEITNANVARNDPDVMVYIGTYNSGAAKVSMPILNRAGILMISPANTSPPLTKPGYGDQQEPACYQPSGEKNYIRVVPTDDVQGSVAAQWASDLGMKRVYILDDKSMYGQGIANRFEDTAKKMGMTVLGHESIDHKQLEFKPLMEGIKGKSPDLVYFGGTTQTKAGQLCKDMVGVQLKVPLMAPDGCYEQALISGAGADTFNALRFYVTFGGLPVNELREHRGPTFLKRYEDLYGQLPTEAYAAYGYECGLVALEAIRKAGRKDRRAIREAGLSIKNFEGTATVWSIDENGDTDSKAMSGNTIENGDFKFVRKLELK